MLSGAVSGVIFAGVGALGLSGLPQFFAHTAAGALSGASNAAINGGDIGRGAMIGGASAGAANLIGNNVPFLQDVAGDDLGVYFTNVTRRASIGAIVGGSVSAATGGRFGRGAAQGAMTSAIAYTANDWMHKAKEWGARVFEGSRYGGGAGGAAKLKVWNVEGGIKMHDIMGKEFSGGKWVNFYEEKYVIYGEAGKYGVNSSYENGKWIPYCPIVQF